MNKKYSLFITFLFSGLLAGVFLVQVLTPVRGFSPEENRMLAAAPAWTAKGVMSGEFMRKTEEYVTDQFPGRDALVTLKARCEILSGKGENNGVILAADDTLIPRFEAPNRERMEKNIRCVRDFTENCPVPVTFALIPDKAEIWREKMPAGAVCASEKEVIDAAAAETGAHFADLFAPLYAAREEPIFYRTDHHWTSEGAYVAYAALGECLGYTPIPLADYEMRCVSRNFCGTAYSASGIRWLPPDEIHSYVPSEGITVQSRTVTAAEESEWEERDLYEEKYLSEKDQYSYFLGGNQALGIVRTPGREGEKLLLVRDSYADSLVPFLTAHFSEIHLIDLRYYKGSVRDYVRDNGIDRVMICYSVPNFVTDTNLAFLKS